MIDTNVLILAILKEESLLDIVVDEVAENARLCRGSLSRNQRSLLTKGDRDDVRLPRTRGARNDFICHSEERRDVAVQNQRSLLTKGDRDDGNRINTLSGACFALLRVFLF